MASASFPEDNRMRFEFATATRIIFGAGTLGEIGPLAAGLGGRAFVVVGGSTGRAEPLFNHLRTHGLECETYSVSGEPTTDVAREGARLAREFAPDLVIGFGGGSVLDAGKAIAALVTNTGDPLDYLEVIGRGQPLTKPSLPYIAIPTTAGTGAEVTRNAVLASPEHQVKVSLRSPSMLPRVALVDPELTYSLPPGVTASTGLDALTQVIEPYVSRLSNPVTDSLCREGMRRAARSLRRAYDHGDDRQAREDMALTSLLGGLALANAKLGAVHGFAGPIGGMYPAPHGVVCARLLPHVIEANVRALQERQPQSQALARYDEIGQIITGSATATAADAVSWVQDVCKALQVPPLGSFGVRPEDLPVLVEKGAVSSSMKGNPLELSSDELRGILARAL